MIDNNGNVSNEIICYFIDTEPMIFNEIWQNIANISN